MNKAVGLLAAATMVLAACGGDAARESGAPSESIEVHGEWAIDIYNEDGSLDRSVDFSNALFSDGLPSLIPLLLGEVAPGEWLIYFGRGSISDPATDVCPSNGPSRAGNCVIDPVLTTVDLFGGSGEETLRLSGSAAVEQDGTIPWVATAFGTCSADTTPNDCDRSHGLFTTKDIDPADVQAVSAGQVVQVQVDISFATG